MNKPLTFGDMVGSYRIIGMSENKVLAKSETAADPFVVWDLEDDKCGVRNGRYRTTYESAQEEFLNL